MRSQGRFLLNKHKLLKIKIERTQRTFDKLKAKLSVAIVSCLFEGHPEHYPTCLLCNKSLGYFLV